MIRRKSIFGALLVSGVLTVSMLAPVEQAQAQSPSCTITGTEADDVLIGTAGDDVICGLGGDDTIDAGAGNDIIYGDGGDDYVEAGLGADVIYGGLGNDELRGNEDNDEIYGEEGDDVVGGGKGDDLIYGGDGADFVEGKRGADVIYGGLGNDELRGNEDNDEIYGEEGDDVVGGGKGDDLIYGGDGADFVEGKRGADVIYGGLGNDELRGNDGDDELRGNEGDDTLRGNQGNDVLGGGKNDDVIDGGNGDDILEGKKGDDLLVGGQGADIADGGPGEDFCIAESPANCEQQFNTALRSFVEDTAPVADAYAGGQPDYAGSWVDNDLGVLYYAFTGSIAAHEADLAGLGIDVSSQHLEIVQQPTSYSELKGAFDAVVSDMDTLGPNFGAVSASLVARDNLIYVGTTVSDGSTLLAHLEVTYGGGLFSVFGDAVDTGLKEIGTYETDWEGEQWVLYDSRDQVETPLDPGCTYYDPHVDTPGLPERAYDSYSCDLAHSGTMVFYNPTTALSKRGTSAFVARARTGSNYVMLTTGHAGNLNDLATSGLHNLDRRGPRAATVDASYVDIPDSMASNLQIVEVNVGSRRYAWSLPITAVAVPREGDTVAFNGIRGGLRYGTIPASEDWVGGLGERDFMVRQDDEIAPWNASLPGDSGAGVFMVTDEGLTALGIVAGSHLQSYGWGGHQPLTDRDPVFSFAPIIAVQDDLQVDVVTDTVEPETPANLLINGSFETGDITGWDAFLVPGAFEDTVMSVSDGYSRTGTFSGSVSTCSVPVEAGFEQTVAVTPGQRYYASAWFVGDRSDIGFEVIAPDDTVLVSAFSTPYGTGQYGARVDDFVAPGSEVRFRLVYLARYLECVEVFFDDAVLSVDPPPLNLGFETGDLIGWEHVESDHLDNLGASVETSPVWEGNYSARLRVRTDQPNGLERQGVTVDNCTSVRTQLTFGPSATARLEIESSTGVTYTDDLLLDTVGAWRFVEVFHPSLGDDTTIRLLVVNGDGSQVAFDDVVPGSCT